MRIRVLNATELRQALPMAEAIEAMKAAFRQLSRGQAEVPLRSRLPVPAVEGVSLVMPAFLKDSREMAVKVVSVFPQNPALNLPTIHAAVLALDPETGQPTALIEGGALTALRTGAGSGAATQALARPDARSVAIIGSGVQARTQLEAVCTAREIERVRVFSLDTEEAQDFAHEMAGQSPIPAEVMVAPSPEAAVAEADIICTATTSSQPVFPGSALKPGAHINAIGSFTPEMEEVDLETLQRSWIVVDSLEAALEEAGDLLGPLRRGELKEEDIHGEIGQVLAGDIAGRSDPEQITYYKSVGVAVQDAAAAAWALRGAERQQLGQELEL